MLGSWQLNMQSHTAGFASLRPLSKIRKSRERQKDFLHTSLERPQSHEQYTTTDKRLRYASPKLPSATSFIRKTLYEILKNYFTVNKEYCV